MVAAIGTEAAGKAAPMAVGETQAAHIPAEAEAAGYRHAAKTHR
jgi:hypothetical protein